MKRNKALEIAVAVIFAIGLWLYVVTTVTPEDDILITDIPVIFQGETDLRNKELLASNKSASTVSVRFHGSRADLKQLGANKSYITAVLDVSQLSSEREYSMGYEIKLPAVLQDRDIQVSDRSPKTVQFLVEKLSTRTVPVKGVFDGTLAPGYVQGELSYDQDVVTVTGPSDLVAQVNYAQVIVGGDDVTQSFTKSVSITLIGEAGAILHSNDLSTSTQEIQVTMPVLMEKKLPLKIVPIFGSGATEENTSLSIEPAEVMVRGPKDVLADMESLILGEFDLSLCQDGIPVSVEIAVPESVELVEGEKTANVTATFVGLEQLTVPVAKIVTEGLPAGMSAKFVSNDLQVTLRGPSEALIELEDSDVSAVAELSDYKESGSFTVPVRIETGSKDVGAVGEYTVTVELKLLHVDDAG